MANSCISGSNCANGVVSVLLGNGDGTFHPAVSYGSGGSLAQSVAVEDVNRDGKLDLVVANYCASGIACFISSSLTGVLGVLMGNGDGTFQPVVGNGSGGYAAYTLAIGDLNRDGKPDLVVANRCSSFACTNSGGIGVLLGNGDGTFQAPVITSTPSPANNNYPETGVQSLTLADFDGDGKMDVASSSNSLLLGNGDGTFQTPIALGPSSPDIAVGDFNSDGKPDLEVGGVTILLNMASNSPHATTTVAPSSLKIGRFSYHERRSADGNHTSIVIRRLKPIEDQLAEACASRTHRRRGNPPPAGFEDREVHRSPFASLIVSP